MEIVLRAFGFLLGLAVVGWLLTLFAVSLIVVLPVLFVVGFLTLLYMRYKMSKSLSENTDYVETVEKTPDGFVVRKTRILRKDDGGFHREVNITIDQPPSNTDRKD